MIPACWPRLLPPLLPLLLLLLLPALSGCPRNDTTYCVPGGDFGGCEGTEWEDQVTAQALPDGDGTCPAGTFLFCTDEGDCQAADPTDVMEATCEHAYDHDWSDCTVRFLCGPVEDAEGCCFLIEVYGATED
jgi:hypothetical protein